MKLVRSQGDDLIFRLGRREKSLLLELLALYPRVPGNYQPASKAGTTSAETEQLLHDSLAEERQSSRQRLKQFVTDRDRFREDEQGVLLCVTAAEYEWLLQVLNDIRVGSWIKLGAPEKNLDQLVPNEQTMPDLWAMELSGYFQAGLLKVLDSGGR